MSLPRYFIFVSCAIDVVFEVKEKVFSNIKKIVDLPDYFPMLNVDLSLKKKKLLRYCYKKVLFLTFGDVLINCYLYFYMSFRPFILFRLVLNFRF